MQCFPFPGGIPLEKEKLIFAGNFPANMNAYLSKLMMYHEIHRMSREGFSVSKICRELGQRVAAKSDNRLRGIRGKAGRNVYQWLFQGTSEGVAAL
jgi:hypothetical protein